MVLKQKENFLAKPIKLRYTSPHLSRCSRKSMTTKNTQQIDVKTEPLDDVHIMVPPSTTFYPVDATTHYDFLDENDFYLQIVMDRIAAEWQAFYDKLSELDKNAFIYAEEMHKKRIVYLLFGALDGLSLSNSLLKYLWDLYFTNGNLHDWLLSPTGIALTAAESIALIVCGAMGNYYKDDDPELWKQRLAKVWPYVRHALKGSKNAYKGFRSMIFACAEISKHDLNFLILPMSITLGVVSISCRFYLQWMRDNRKKMMDENDKLLDEVIALPEYTQLIANQYLAQMRSQTRTERNLGIFVAALGGSVDSLYLFMGALGLATVMGTPLTIGILACCVVFTVLNIISRIYEEYNYQLLLDHTRTRIEFALYSKCFELQLKTNLDELNALTQLIALNPNSLDLIAIKIQKEHQITSDIEIYSKKRNYFQRTMLFTELTSILSGIRHGFAVYSAIASAVFAISTILTITTGVFPAGLVVAMVAAGLIGILVYTAHNYSLQATYRQKVFAEADMPKDRLNSLVKAHSAIIDVAAVSNALSGLIELDSGPRIFTQERGEIFRSALSGVNKSTKSAEFTMGGLEYEDDLGNYHDSSFMLAVAGIGSLFYGVVFMLRSLARGYGRQQPGFRTPKEEVFPMLEAQPSPQPDYSEEEDEFIQTLSLPPSSSQESAPPPEPRADSDRSFHRSASVNRFAFFPENTPLKRPPSLPNLLRGSSEEKYELDNTTTAPRLRSISYIG